MSQVLCVHCQQPIEAGAPRRGNLVTCTSCKGQVYVPQVQEVATYEQRQAAARAASAGQHKAGSKAHSRSGGRGAVHSNGLSVAAIILVILVVGGSALSVAGFFVYRAIKGHMDARKQLATSKYDFEKPPDSPTATPAPKSRTTDDAGSTSLGLQSLNDKLFGNRPTRSDLEKLQKAFQAYEEASNRLQQDYKEDLVNTGLNRLLVADRIAADREFKESREIIVAARKVIDKHRKLNEEEDKAFLRDLGRLRLEGVPTEVMVERIRGVLVAVQPHVDKFWGTDVSIAGHYEQAINHLEATHGTWKLDGEVLVFNQTKDAERYKTFFDEVDKCVQLQADLGHKIGAEVVPRYLAAFGLTDS